MKTAEDKIAAMERAGFRVEIDWNHPKGNEVLCTVREPNGGKLRAFDFATCGPDDKFDLKIGREIAVGRVWKELEKECRIADVWQRAADAIGFSRHYAASKPVFLTCPDPGGLGIPKVGFRVEIEVGMLDGPQLWKVPWRTSRQIDDSNFWPIEAKSHWEAVDEFQKMCEENRVPWMTAARGYVAKNMLLGSGIRKLRSIRRDDGQTFLWERERGGPWVFKRIV